VRVLGVIPARMGATRFPGKPLVDLAGRPLVEWVHRAAVDSQVFDEVVVATPDEEIAATVESFGGTAVLTSAAHETGTDRVAEVARGRSDAEVVVNVQGDQPFVTPVMLRELVRPFQEPDPPEMSTLAAPLGSSGRDDPNTVKVVCNLRGDAMYFSRSQVPHPHVAGEGRWLHHIGLYGFRQDFLRTFAGLPSTPLERCEGLEQLRALEHGHAIRVMTVDGAIIEVNTPADLADARDFALRADRG